MCLDNGLVVKEFCDLGQVTYPSRSISLCIQRRMDWVVSYFTGSKMYGLWVVAVVFHILISLNLECIHNNYNQFCPTIIIGRVIFLAAFIIYGRLEPMKFIK